MSNTPDLPGTLRLKDFISLIRGELSEAARARAAAQVGGDAGLALGLQSATAEVEVLVGNSESLSGKLNAVVASTDAIKGSTAHLRTKLLLNFVFERPIPLGGSAPGKDAFEKPAKEKKGTSRK